MCIEMHSMKIMVIERLRLCPWTPLFFVEPFNFLPEWEKKFLFLMWNVSTSTWDLISIRLGIWYSYVERTNKSKPNIQSFIPFLSLFYGFFFFRNHQTKLFIFRQAICLYCSIKVCIFYNSQRIFIEPTLLINTHRITSYKIELKTTRLCFPMSNSKMF